MEAEQKLDVNLIIKELGLRKANLEGEELNACCPNPQHEDRTPSWSFNIESQFYNCWSCGFSGKGLSGLFLKLGKNPPDWVLTMPEPVKKKRRRLTTASVPVPFLIRQSWMEWLSGDVEGAIEKLSERDIDPEIIKFFGIGYNKTHDILYFPCKDSNGNLIGWAERSDTWPNRWRMQPDGVSKASLLFGADKIEVGKKNTIYLVEGAVDALKLWQWGFKAVAVMGSVLYQEQVERILDLAHQVIFIPDNDKAGLKLRWYVVEYLRGKTMLSGVNLPPDIKDVGENACTFEIVKKAISERVKIV